MTSTINKKILIHYSFGGQKNKNKNKEVLITSLAEFRINIYNFIKKTIFHIICQRMHSAIPKIFRLVQFDLWNKEMFFFAVPFVWFNGSLI